MSRARLLRRLSGRSGDQLDDLRRLLAVRSGETPARPDLGLPVLPPWLPDAEARRRLQEAIAASLRAGEPRLAGVAVQDGGVTDASRFTIHARCSDGSTLGATARVDYTGNLELGR